MNIISFLFGGWLASFIISFIISLLFYIIGYKKELDKLTEDLNQQFTKQQNFLNKIHNEREKSLLKMYKNRLVHQLENDIANIWDVRPGAMVSANLKNVDINAMVNADEKYYKTFEAIVNRSEEIINKLLEKTENL